MLSGLVFFGVVLSSFGSFADVVSVFLGFVFAFLAFSSKRERSGGHRPPPHAPVFVVFLFVVLPRLFGSPVLAVRPASRRFFGVPFWAPRVFGILLEPSEALFLGTRGGRGVSWLLVLVCCFFPLLFCFCFAASHV